MYGFQVGDAVVCVKNGYGVVTSVCKDRVIASFGSKFNTATYYADGRLFAEDFLPFLNHRKDFELIPGKPVRTKPAPQFKPGQVVVVSKGAGFIWRVDIYSHTVIKPVTDIRYVCISRAYKYCLPLEGNEHLIGTFFDNAIQEGL